MLATWSRCWKDLNEKNLKQCDSWFWVDPQCFPPLHLSICVPTYMHNTRPHLCTQPRKQCECGWVAQVFEGPLGLLSDAPTECVTQNANCPYVSPNTSRYNTYQPPLKQTPDTIALSQICETKHDFPLLKTVKQHLRVSLVPRPRQAFCRSIFRSRARRAWERGYIRASFFLMK